MAGRGSEPHFLLLPFTEQGHMSPMLSLASQLVALGCRVTFVKAERAQGSSAEKQKGEEEAGKGAEEERLRFVAVEGAAETAQSERENVQTLKSILEGLEERQGRLVARLLRESLASDHPISCIIADFFMWKWVSPLALSVGVPVAILVACSATFFFIHHLQQKGRHFEMENLLVSGFGLPGSKFHDGLPSSRDAPEVKEKTTYFFNTLTDGLTSSRNAPEVKKKTIDFFNTLFEGIDDAGHILLVNSFKHLEAPLLPFLEVSPLDFRFIGPCLPTWNRDHVGLGNIMAQRAGSAFSEEHACLPWLERQEKGSVLFVSFGSQATMRAEEQTEELVLGIEKSGYKFLWVVRPDAPVATQPPAVFRERINKGGGERGMFVSWVPQKRVLQHPAVGGFLTHSGWNSTLESVTFGVPMLCLPFFGDQSLNANMVHEYWKIGLRLGPSKTGLVGREEVERGVHTIMQGHMSGCVANFKKAAEIATTDAHQTLASFVQAITPSK